MTESFRSTRPILEFACNVIDRLPHRTESPDLDELVPLGMLERGIRNGSPWLTVHFNEVSGSPPKFQWKISWLPSSIKSMSNCRSKPAKTLCDVPIRLLRRPPIPSRDTEAKRS